MNQKLKFLRETLGLTEKEISLLLNISSYKYAALEKVGTDVPCEIVLLLSRIYNIDIELLINNNFTNKDLLTEIRSKNYYRFQKNDMFDALKENLLGNFAETLSYRSIKKIKGIMQQDIINNLLTIIKVNNLTKYEFSDISEIDVEKFESLLTKKRFIDINELIIISKNFNVLISDIAFGKI